MVAGLRPRFGKSPVTPPQVAAFFVLIEGLQYPTLGHLISVENFVDAKVGSREPAQPTGWQAYFRPGSSFLTLCF
jgi:hypothetical protein